MGACDAYDQFITEFLSAVKPHAAKIRNLSESHNVTVSLVYHVDELPYVGLTRGQIQAIAALGAKVEYDFMLERNLDEAEEPDSVEMGQFVSVIQLHQQRTGYGKWVGFLWRQILRLAPGTVQQP